MMPPRSIAMYMYLQCINMMPPCTIAMYNVLTMQCTYNVLTCTFMYLHIRVHLHGGPLQWERGGWGALGPEGDVIIVVVVVKVVLVVVVR